MSALRQRLADELENLKGRLESETRNTKLELLEEKDDKINKLKVSLFVLTLPVYTGNSVYFTCIYR